MLQAEREPLMNSRSRGALLGRLAAGDGDPELAALLTEARRAPLRSPTALADLLDTVRAEWRESIEDQLRP